MNVWKLWAESKDLNDDIVKHKAKELEECHSRFFAEICKSESSLPVQNNQTVALACQTVLLHFWCYHSCFSTKPQLNTERSFLVPYLNLCFGFTTAVTAKTEIWKFLSWNYFMLFVFNGLYWFCKKMSVFFFSLTQKDC